MVIILYLCIKWLILLHSSFVHQVCQISINAAIHKVGAGGDVKVAPMFCSSPPELAMVERPPEPSKPVVGQTILTAGRLSGSICNSSSRTWKNCKGHVRIFFDNLKQNKS